MVKMDILRRVTHLSTTVMASSGGDVWSEFEFYKGPVVSQRGCTDIEQCVFRSGCTIGLNNSYNADGTQAGNRWLGLYGSPWTALVVPQFLR